MLFRRTLLAGGLSSGVVLALPAVLRAEAAPADRLVAAARKQVGVTLTYDAAYSRLDYPGGDVPRERGVCTDVLVRAYRDGLGIDLQVLVHEDMRRAFSAYPALWGLKKTDRNIDHRRVPNLQAFFKRAGAALASSENYLPGDIVSQMLPGNLPHIGIVADERSSDGSRPIVVHNIGAGARLEDVLFAYPITGHYRYGV
ncbi:DUF1287 domain-containing protein [Shinella sp.]|uniref:DUF1287 domain-containing protein n=1 Tax=Shinella sp. TaxID=1870904 RepID=UPI004036909C